MGEIEANDAGTHTESVAETDADAKNAHTETKVKAQSKSAEPQINKEIDVTNQSNLSQSQLQAISRIRVDWLEELRKTYPEDPMIQELLQQLQEGALSPTKFNL
jgi:hypothetical protein